MLTYCRPNSCCLKLIIIRSAKVKMNQFMCVLCGQRMGDRGAAGGRSVGTPDLPTDACAEAGPFHAGSTETAGGADEDHG